MSFQKSSANPVKKLDFCKSKCSDFREELECVLKIMKANQWT